MTLSADNKGDQPYQHGRCVPVVIGCVRLALRDRLYLL